VVRNQKQLHEADVFFGFISAAQLPIDPCSVENEAPPFPDIRCIKNPDTVCRFELAEILWEDPAAEIKSLAHGLALSKQASDEKAALLAAGRFEEAHQIQTCGGFEFQPLASLVQVLEKKCAKHYQTDGSSVSLLLYYERESPQAFFERLIDCSAAVHTLLATSQFSDVWLYHHSVAYTLDFSGIPDGAVVSVPLRNLATPESQRRVIGHLALTGADLTISLDASYSQAYSRASDALTAARNRYKAQSEQNLERGAG
jgi:hypothetical protein